MSLFGVHTYHIEGTRYEVSANLYRASHTDALHLFYPDHSVHNHQWFL